jgi:hypothetical protein
MTSKSSDERPPTPIARPAQPLPPGVRVEQRPPGPAGGELPTSRHGGSIR